MHEYDILEKGKPLDQAKNALILLHGRGGSAQDIITLADEFCDETFYIAAPQATHRTWYPHGFLTPEAQNEPWLSSAVQTVQRLIDETAAVLPVENIYLMGFSQGACLALEAAARRARRYGGVAAFTGGLIGETVDPAKYGGDFAGTPVFIGNSDRDPHVPVERSRASGALMERLGAAVQVRIYPGMAHTVVLEEIYAVQAHLFGRVV